MVYIKMFIMLCFLKMRFSMLLVVVSRGHVVLIGTKYQKLLLP